MFHIQDYISQKDLIDLLTQANLNEYIPMFDLPDELVFDVSSGLTYDEDFLYFIVKLVRQGSAYVPQEPLVIARFYHDGNEGSCVETEEHIGISVKRITDLQDAFYHWKYDRIDID